MKMALRAVVLLAVFALVGWTTAHLVYAHAAVRTAGYAPEARLGANMAGLFAGGVATVLTLIAMLLAGRKQPQD